MIVTGYPQQLPRLSTLTNEVAYFVTLKSGCPIGEWDETATEMRRLLHNYYRWPIAMGSFRPLPCILVGIYAEARETVENARIDREAERVLRYDRMTDYGF